MLHNHPPKERAEMQRMMGARKNDMKRPKGRKMDRKPARSMRRG